jgi:DNA-binding PadR family transcriptional regulator
MDILPIRKLYILPRLINVSRSNMVKPKGTTGATKMKIIAIICHNCENGVDSYGYTIWQALKEYFHIYLIDNDVRNVYHHLKELTELDYIVRDERLNNDPSKRCLYQLTEKGRALEGRYVPYLDIMRKSPGLISKY